MLPSYIDKVKFEEKFLSCVFYSVRVFTFSEILVPILYFLKSLLFIFILLFLFLLLFFLLPPLLTLQPLPLSLPFKFLVKVYYKFTINLKGREKEGEKNKLSLVINSPIPYPGRPIVCFPLHP